MSRQIDKALSFELSGRFAHFRKFYTNSSSLSYLIPPRTVIMGMLGSILMAPRDSYYELFSEENCKISVSVVEGSSIKRSTHSLNMLHEKYHSFLEKGSGSSANMHAQCKLELLSSGSKLPFAYRIYTAFLGNLNLMDELETKLKSHHSGYGLYLGQRQFRASIGDVRAYPSNEIAFLDQSEFLDSVCDRENVLSISNENDPGFYVVVEQMPVHMKHVLDKNRSGREPSSIKRVLFERNGKRLSGSFKNCYHIGDKIISFY